MTESLGLCGTTLNQALRTQRRIWHSPCLQVSRYESKIKYTRLRSKLVRKDRIWQLVIPDKCYGNSVLGVTGAGCVRGVFGRRATWVSLGSGGSERHREAGEGMPSTTNGVCPAQSRTCKWTEASLLGWWTASSKSHPPVLSSLHRVGGQKEWPKGLQYK